jgi:Na+/melibiose symporter-like transporter
MKICQIIILVMLVAALFTNLWSDFHGRKDRKPYGFGGAVVTIILMALTFWCYKEAGAFSTIFP